MTTISVDWPSILASQDAIVNTAAVTITGVNFNISLPITGTYSTDGRAILSTLGITRQLAIYATAIEQDPPLDNNIFGLIYIEGSQNNVFQNETISLQTTVTSPNQIIATTTKSYSTVDKIIIYSDPLVHFPNQFIGNISVGLWLNGYIALDVISARSSESTGSGVMFKLPISNKITYKIYQSIVNPINIYFDSLSDDNLIFPIPELNGTYNSSMLTQVNSNYYSLVGFINTVNDISGLGSSLSMQVMVL